MYRVWLYTGIVKKAVAYRLSPNAIALIALMTEKLGISQAAVLELAIRLLAEREKVKVGK